MEDEFTKKAIQDERDHIFYVKKVFVDPQEKESPKVKLLELDLDKFEGKVSKLDQAILLSKQKIILFITEVKRNKGTVTCVVMLTNISDDFPNIKEGDELAFFENACGDIKS